MTFAFALACCVALVALAALEGRRPAPPVAWPRLSGASSRALPPPVAVPEAPPSWRSEDAVVVVGSVGGPSLTVTSTTQGTCRCPRRGVSGAPPPWA